MADDHPTGAFQTDATHSGAASHDNVDPLGVPATPGGVSAAGPGIAGGEPADGPTGPLVDVATLAAAMAGPRPPVLLDVRWRLGGPPGRTDYDAGHLPGAQYVDLDTELASAPGSGGRHPLPDPADLGAALRRAGVRGDCPVVVYDAADGSIAARAWWLLRWIGHTDVAVLDGGYAAWVGDGRPVSSELDPDSGGKGAGADETGANVAGAAVADGAGRDIAVGDSDVRPGAMPVLDADAAAALARDGVLLDARAAARYRGETEPIDPKAGHIPGARNAPAADHVGADGRWLGVAELAARFAELGARPGEPVGAYCGSGVTAASVVLALEVAGVTTRERPAALYVGSWSHWCTKDRPVATGADPG